jgi:hypothetical protein
VATLAKPGEQAMLTLGVAEPSAVVVPYSKYQ